MSRPWGSAAGPDPDDGPGPAGDPAGGVPAGGVPAGGAPAEPVDLVGVAAVAIGFVGIVVFGILAALVTGVLGAWAGQRARAAGRSLQLAYLAIGLAMLDGIVWLVLQFLFELPAQIG